MNLRKQRYKRHNPMHNRQLTPSQQSTLLDLKARITRALLEQEFEPCVLALARDTSELLTGEDPQHLQLLTRGEHGRVIIVTR